MARGCCSKTAAERELYRYYQPNLPAKLVDKNGVPITRPSVDACMTAFAQLGALRLNASRGIISLAVKETEYILAEAGKTLTLQEDDDEQDSLWHGFGELEKGKGLGPELVQHFRDHPEDSYLVIKDLKDHPTLKHKKVVDETSRVRFLACVPLRAPFKSTVIGNFIVIDGEPRDGLSEDELQYLIDLGTTVMEYLESGRAKQKQDRAERLVKALGLFVEGKATLRDWWLGGGHNYQASKIKRAAKYGITLESRADFEFGVQDPENVHLVQGIESLNQRRPRLRNTDSSISSTLPPASIQSEKEPSVFESTANTTVESEGIDHDIHSDSSSDEIPKNLQEALVSSDVKNVFARASNLIREATALEGVVFYDASVGTFGGRVKRDIAEDKAPGGFIIADVDTSTSSEENLKHTSPGPDGAVQPHSLLQHTQDAEKACNILGYSTRRRSSLKAHIPSNELRGFPEKMMRRLLKKYPHGKVFNFDEHGSFSSDSEGATTEAEGQQSPTPEAKVRRTKVRMSKEAEAAAILSVLPGARSVFWFPLWDQAKERWFAGSLVWSVVPTRALCPVEDLTYMAAFGNSVMAEVSRLSALAAAQMKSDFISSISHELRSPLHGVLASVEFLQETQMTDMQTDMVNNISASGKVLLDTINHVLDFSNVNKRMKRRPKKFRRKGRRPSKEPSRERKDPEATEDAEDICVMSDEVVNSVYAGRNVGRLAQEVSADRRSRPGSVGAIQPQSPVTVIMDISYRPQWMFEIDAGAWRRILMNLFSNAIKYTDTGFVKVTLNIEDEPSSLGQRPHSSLFLKVSDSGKGISQEFLKHHLFKPFSQEDSLAVGTGLGLSIVRQIVHEIGGEIYFTSEQGTGTEAMVRIPLTPSNSSLTNDGPDSVVEVRKVTNGLKASFVGFDRYPEISETPTGILSADSEAAMILRSSVKSTMHNWFGIQETTNAAADHLADLEIIMEAGIDAQALNENLSALRNARAGIRTMAIVLCSKFIPRPHNDSKDFKVVYLQQPYGPLKYVKALYDGFCKDESIEIVNSTTNNAEVIPANGNFTTSQRLLKDSILDENSVPEPKSLPSVCTQPRSTNGLTVGNVKKPLANGVNNMQGMRVLLVEDNVINLKLLVTYMRKLNIDHATAMNGLEALNAYKDAHGKFDIVFMDISMPVMSGIESTRHIRGFEEEKSLKPVALIALTGAANPAARQEAYASGIDLFLTKPVPMKALKKMLEDFKTSGREALSTNDD